MKTPLAWKNLTSSPGKFLLCATGVGFAVLLMFMQIGFQNALFDSNVEMIRLFKADVVMVSPARFNFSSERRFAVHWLQRASTIDGVEAVSAVRTERSLANLKVDRNKARTIRILAIDPDKDFIADDELVQKLQQADSERGVLVDRRSKRDYGFVVDNRDALRSQYAELNNTQIRLSDTFELGTDFANDGTLLMSNRLFPSFFPYRSPTRDAMDVVDFGLIKLKPGADRKTVLNALSQLNEKETNVYGYDDYIHREVLFWSRNTPIGIIFGIGTAMGLIVGGIICYQIQFTDITEHMPELATLKAMGYSNGYFWSLVLCQSIYLAFIGFVPGLIITQLLYRILAEYSGLVMRLNEPTIAIVALLTIGMCLISGLLALRKLWRADPASLF